jgi:hypothetical protein
LRVFSDEPASESDCLHCVCHSVGGVGRWWEVEIFRGEFASVSDCVHGECHTLGGVERWC